MKFAIAHCAWLPERRITLARLLDQLAGEDVIVLTSPGPEHASIWARRLWEAADYGDHTCVLNDDVILHPNFGAIVRAMVEAVPDECLSLHTSSPCTETGPWARCYHYTGPAVIFPPHAADSLLEYVYSLPWSFLSRFNEDNVAIHWAWEHQRPFYCAIPAPVNHDVIVKSTLGYDHHPNRKPSVPWENFPDANLTSVDYWKPTGEVPMIENPWMPPERMDYVRKVLKAGRQICATCLAREGVVGSQAAMICNTCLSQAWAAVTRGANP